MRIVFLGDRRLAQTAWISLVQNYSADFEVVLAVTNEKFYADVVNDNSIPFLSNSDRHAEEILRTIEKHKVDYLVSIQHNWKMPKKVLEAVDYNAINLHNATLPNYKGYYSINHAIARGDEKFYTTVHWMSDKIDSGDIAYEFESIINTRTTAISLYMDTVEKVRTNISVLYNDILNSNIPRRKMPQDDGKFYSRESIHSLRDITQIVDEEIIDRHVRACFFPGYESAYIRTKYGKQYIVPETSIYYNHCYSNVFNQHSKV